MLPIETGQKVDKKSISSSFDDGLNDHRSHIDDGRSGGVEESSRFVPNKSQATPYRGNSHPTNADGNAQSGKPINRRRSSVGRSRAASFSKMSSSVGKKIAHKNSVFREDENVVRSSENTMHHLTSNGANEFKDANTRERAESRVSYTSEADSTGSRSSQETEEDVCFPMEREQVKLNGIDFGVINEFIREERQDNNSKHEEPIVRSFSIDDANPRYATSNTTGAPYRFQKSLAASKYTPMRALKSMFQRPKEERRTSSTGLSHLGQDERKIDFNSDDSFSEAEVKFGGACVTDGTSGGALPNRFSFFHSESEETVHAPDIPSL
ncbi:hypothetical protein CANMA_004633, partial [Candida margitis]|uniref:uncharacterized protein n=1 Tax=Candida margitis TaxID=1775924 RepID=UPI002226B6F3